MTIDEPHTDTRLTAPRLEEVEILQLLGHGGMSLVYKARQAQLDRVVAVKVLSTQVEETAIKRFWQEAILTKEVVHPNIVKVYSCGVSADGQLYIVMEYLEGSSLEADLRQNWCLNLKKFEDVFLPVLSALAEAHRIGLIHRDLKPANIMICHSETANLSIKLVDFGIARLLGHREAQAPTLTAPGTILGSPLYMSPEQCMGTSTDARSDLYSLACVMYEAISGEPPYSGSSALEVMQKHCTMPLPRAGARGRTREEESLLQVILWGLAKDPSKRPQSAAAFALRLEEEFEDIASTKLKKSRPVSGKRFNWIAQLVTSLCLLLCSSVMIREQFGEDGSWKRVEKSTGVKDECESKNSLARIERTCGPEHPSVVRLLDHLACDLYLQQNRLAEAESLMKRSLKIREHTLGPRHLEVASCLFQLGDLYKKQGRYTEAEPLIKRCLAIRESRLNAENADVGIALVELADILAAQRKYEQAEPLSQRSLQIWTHTLPPEHPLLLGNLKSLGELYRNQLKYAQATLLLERCLRSREKTLGPDHADVAESLYSLAELCMAQGNYLEAESLLARALPIKRKIAGPEHPDVAVGLLWQGDLYMTRGKFAEAEPLFKTAIAIVQKSTHHDHRLGELLLKLGELNIAQGKYGDAELALKRSVQIGERALAANHPELGYRLLSLANLYTAQHRYSEAEPLLKKSLAISERKPGDSRLAVTLLRLGQLYLAQREYALAEPLIERCLQMSSKKLRSPERVSFLVQLANAKAKHQLSLPLLEKAVKILQK